MNTINNWITASMLSFGVLAAPVARAELASSPGEDSASENVVTLELQQKAYPAPGGSPQVEGRTTAEALRFWQDKLAAYKRMGGPAYKSGLVRSAEIKVAHLSRLLAEENGTVFSPSPSPAAALPHEARAEELKRGLAGAGYKTGLVQREEALARKHGSTIGQTESNVAGTASAPPSKTAAQILKATSGS